MFTLTLDQRDSDLYYLEGEEWKPLSDLRITSPPGLVSDSQFARISEYIPKGFPPPNQDDIFTVSAIAADNLINRNSSRWTPRDLSTMTKLIVGKPALQDHDSYSVAKIWGRVYDANLISSTPSDSLIDRINRGDDNRRILAKEGYQQIAVQIFTNKDHPVVQEIAMGRRKEMSVGGFMIQDLYCPECDISIYNSRCPHYFNGSPDASKYGDRPQITYINRHGLYDLLELSLVTSPNLPGAGVV